MAMMTNPKYLALLLTLAAPASFAQQDEAPATSDEASAEMPDEFVAEDQVVPVAEEGISETIPEDDLATVPELDNEVRLLAEFELFKQLMYDDVLDEADTVAKRVVELAIDTHGPQSNEFAKALTNLAIVQFRTEQYDSSIQNFESAIEIIEDNEDRLNAQLINPLKGLGAAQLEFGRPDLASQTFQRAVHVTHVNEGPHNLDQIELLESIAETYARMGDMEAAKEAQDAIYALNIREHQLDTPALIPSLMRRAEWQHRSGFIYDERATYRRAIRIIEDYAGKESIELVEPLIRLGRSYFFADMSGQTTFQEGSVASGEIYFRRATRIAVESPDSNWRTVAEANLALGDYYLYVASSLRAEKVYAETWELLSEGEEQLRFRREQLEQVVPLRLNKLPLYVEPEDSTTRAAPGESSLQGRAKFSYDVSAKGRAANVMLVEARPPEFEKMVADVQREIRRRIYRPRHVDGVAVDTEGLTLNHKFFYRQSDLDGLTSIDETEEPDGG